MQAGRRSFGGAMSEVDDLPAYSFFKIELLKGFHTPEWP